MDIAAVADVRNGYSIDFLKSTADPVRYAVAPPNTHNNSAFIKKLDYSMNFTVGDDEFPLVPVNEKVPTQSGLVLFFPLLGANSIWHFGIVPGGTRTENPPFNFPALQTVHGLSNKLFYFQFDAPLAIPYQGSSNDQIRIAPDLSLDFSITRMFASVMTLSSPTVPVSGTAFNGQLSIGCIHDTRDIAQVQSGNEVNVYSPTDLSQQSVTSKDGIRDVKSEEGVVGIQGSEIDSVYSAPNQSRVDVPYGEWANIPITNQGYGTRQNSGSSTVVPTVLCLSSIWISPWQTTCETYAAVGAGIALQRIITDAIGESDCLDIKLQNITIRNDKLVGIGATRNYLFYAQAVHVFATCNSDGTVSYSNFMDVFTIPQNTDGPAIFYNNSFATPAPTAFGFGANGGLGNIACNIGTLEFHPKAYQQNMTSTGKYIGTSINIGLLNTSGTVEGGGGGPFNYWIDSDCAGTGVTQVGNTSTQAMIYVKPHSLYNRGVIGPCKVFRWDGQAANSVMRLEGISRVQCIPQGSIAPYVQGAAMNAPNAVDMNALCVCSELYNGNTSFQRSWRANDYYRWIREFIPTLDSTNLYRDAKDSTKTLAALEAGGIFDAIGQGLAGLGIGVGRGITHLLGAGQFGIGGQQPLEAGGQFGLMQSAGQFGGNYGGMRRNRMD